MTQDGRDDLNQLTAGDLEAMQEVIIDLPMLADMELTAGKAATALGEHIRMSPDKIDEVCQAVIEACINAFEHSRAKKRRVKVVFRVIGRWASARGLQILVQDEGIGFSPSNLPEPRIEAAVRSAHKRGWGLKIIHGLMDTVDIQSTDSGTCVTMTKLVRGDIAEDLRTADD